MQIAARVWFSSTLIAIQMLKDSWLFVACVFVVSVAVPAQAQLFQLPQQALAMMRPAGQADIQLAREAESASQWEQAAQAYGRALAAIDDSPATFKDMSLYSLLPAYGRALTQVGRLDEAEMVLLRAIDLKAPAASQSSDGARMGFPEAVRTLQSVFTFGTDTARSMSQNNLLFAGEVGDAWGATLTPRVPQAKRALTLLAEVYARKGLGNKVLDIWQGPFSVYLAGVEAAKPSLRSMFRYEAEIESLHMANALAATSSLAQANATIQLALWFNASRLKDFVLNSSLLEAQLAGFQQRRLLVSALATQRFLLPLGAEQGQALVAAIASSKALGSRYIQHTRALLATSADMKFAEARTQLNKLDGQLMQLPQTGVAAMTAWADWTNAYAAALAPVVPALNQAGLDQLVGDGTDVLRRTRQHLGAAGWIGFFQYTPVDPLTSALGQAHYLRYTISGAGTTVKDLGLRRRR